MIDEMAATVPTVKVRKLLLRTAPCPSGLLHDEMANTRNMWPGFISVWLHNKLIWSAATREIHESAQLHLSVYERLALVSVPEIDISRLDHPDNLRHHKRAAEFYCDALGCQSLWQGHPECRAALARQIGDPTTQP
jgi:hypothetical protein